MIKGIFTSASGMIPRLRKQELIANNISNAGTTGFKRDVLFTKELTRAQQKSVPTKSDWERPMVNSVYTDFESGIFEKTDNRLDFAIEGEGFFKLQLEAGTTVLTRSGSFVVNENGQLAFPGGALVLGEGGPIEVGSGEIAVAQSGEIESNGNIVGRIVPVTVADLTQLEKIGQSAFVVPAGVELISVTQFSIRQGFVENSNVDIVREMIEMIISFRNYESDAKALKMQDDTLGYLFRRVGGEG